MRMAHGAMCTQARDHEARDDMNEAERLLCEGVGTARRVLGAAHPHTHIYAANLHKLRHTQRARRALEEPW